MRILFIISLVLSLSIISCENSSNYIPIPSQINKNVRQKLAIGLKNWHFKDVNIDTVPGISLDRAYDTLLKNANAREIIVAVIDMEIDVNHENLKNNIWVNSNEIVGNHVDDDDNRYVDDINGWNFLGNNAGENNLFVNYEYTRIIKRYSSKFKNKSLNEITPNDSIEFKVYELAEKYYNKRMKYAIEDTVYANMIVENLYNSINALKKYFNNKNYTSDQLDSLKNVHPKDEELQVNILKRSNFMQYGYTINYVNSYKLKADERINKLLNLEYDEREIQGDNSNDLGDIIYGTNQLNGNVNLLDHGTKMAGIIKNIGLKNEIKIMPLCVSAYGDEHDKDIALAIRYAVDNGAKVINMSFAKEFSLNFKWIAEALKYAEDNNVLIVHAASNDGLNLDSKPSLIYPNDHGYYDTIEITNNFLTVAASGKSLDENLKLSYSNYGKSEVDIFAPGEHIYTYLPNNEYTNDAGGTSSATAITSGVAALIYSYFPKLKVQQVKQILMDSGIEYNIEVLTPTENDKKSKTAFNKLSKSGKIVNAYNALLMASQY